MKKKLLSILPVLICALVFTGCGGNGGNSSNLKKNAYFGELPSIYVGYKADVKAYEDQIEAKGKKLLDGGEKNKDKIMKLVEEEQKKSKEMKDKFNAAVKAEVQKLAGKDIPVSYSERLKNSDEQFYTISNVKLLDDDGKLKMSFTISAKEDFVVPRYKGGDYCAYYRLYTEDGTKIEKSVFMPVPADTKPLSFTAGQVLQEDKRSMSISNLAELYANFAGVEFITKDEYSAIK